MKSDSGDSGIDVQTPTSGRSLHGGMMEHLVPPGGANAQQAYGAVAPQQQRDIGRQERSAGVSFSGDHEGSSLNNQNRLSLPRLLLLFDQ